MKKSCEALKEIGKGLIAFVNLLTVLMIVNIIMTKTISPLYAIIIIYNMIIFFT